MLNIKNPEAHRLAHALAEATGQSITAAVTQALREQLARAEKQKDYSREMMKRRVDGVLASIHAVPVQNGPGVNEIVEEGWGGL